MLSVEGRECEKNVDCKNKDYCCFSSHGRTVKIIMTNVFIVMGMFTNFSDIIAMARLYMEELRIVSFIYILNGWCMAVN